MKISWNTKQQNNIQLQNKICQLYLSKAAGEVLFSSQIRETNNVDKRNT